MEPQFRQVYPQCKRKLSQEQRPLRALPRRQRGSRRMDSQLPHDGQRRCEHQCGIPLGGGRDVGRSGLPIPPHLQQRAGRPPHAPHPGTGSGRLLYPRKRTEYLQRLAEPSGTARRHIAGRFGESGRKSLRDLSFVEPLRYPANHGRLERRRQCHPFHAPPDLYGPILYQCHPHWQPRPQAGTRHDLPGGNALPCRPLSGRPFGILPPWPGHHRLCADGDSRGDEMEINPAVPSWIPTG